MKKDWCCVMKSEVNVFDFGEHEVRVVLNESGEPLFVAKDVCGVLGLANNRKALQTLDEDEVAGVTLSNIRSSNGVKQSRRVQVVTESGLYHLIFKSRKAAAKKFRRWVTEQVLPAIRKTGQYQVQDKRLSRREVLEAVLQAELEAERAGEALEMVQPRGEFGEISDVSGQPKIQLVPSYYRTAQSREGMEKAARFMTIQLELRLPMERGAA